MNTFKGVTVVEYALLLGIITIAVALATPKISSAVVRVFTSTASILIEGSPQPKEK